MFTLYFWASANNEELRRLYMLKQDKASINSIKNMEITSNGISKRIKV